MDKDKEQNTKSEETEALRQIMDAYSAVEYGKKYGPECPDGKHEMCWVEDNSYGSMFKCTKCGLEEFV